MTKSINTLVLALVAFNAVTVLGAADPAITNAPAQKRDENLEARQCTSVCSSFLPLRGLVRVTCCFLSSHYRTRLFYPTNNLFFSPAVSDIIGGLTSAVGGVTSVFGDVTSVGGSVFSDVTCTFHVSTSLCAVTRRLIACTDASVASVAGGAGAFSTVTGGAASVGQQITSMSTFTYLLNAICSLHSFTGGAGSLASAATSVGGGVASTVTSGVGGVASTVTSGGASVVSAATVSSPLYPFTFFPKAYADRCCVRYSLVPLVSEPLVLPLLEVWRELVP